MKKLFYILLLPLFFSMKGKENVVIRHRSFYAEMKRLEKPPRVTAFGAVQTANNTQNNGTTCSVTVSSTTANNLLVISIALLSTNTVTSVTDNQSNSYEVGTAQTVVGTYNVYQAYGFQTTGGATSVTITVNSTTAFLCIVDEYSGFTGTPTNAECADAYSSAGGSDPQNVPSFSPVQSGCLIVLSSFNDSNNQPHTPSSGYTAYGTGYYFGDSYTRSCYKLSSGTSEAPGVTVGYGTTGLYARSYKQEDWVAAPSNGWWFLFN